MEDQPQQPTRAIRTARFVGAVVQGVALGVLLFLALMELFSLTTGTRVFRYQGF